MKKMLAAALALALMLTFAFGSTAMATTFDTGRYLTQGEGEDASGEVIKQTGIGSAGKGTATFVSNSSAIFQGTVRNQNGTNASNTARFTGRASFTMTSKNDGYGNALLRTGYKYKLRIAHRSNSPVKTAKCNGDWAP